MLLLLYLVGLKQTYSFTLEHNISGSVLLDLDYEAIKAMDIKIVGERVRLAVAIKALRQECYLAATLAARTPTRV